MIGKQPDSLQVQIGKDLRSQADLAMNLALAFGKGRNDVRDERSETTVADFFRRETFGGLVQVNQRAPLFLGDHLQRSFERLMAIAAGGAENVAQQAVRVHADQNRL